MRVWWGEVKRAEMYWTGYSPPALLWESALPLDGAFSAGVMVAFEVKIMPFGWYWTVANFPTGRSEKSMLVVMIVLFIERAGILLVAFMGVDEGNCRTLKSMY